MNLPRILLAVVLACTTAGLNAMSIRPPSLERLVSSAQAIVRTEVLETRCEERGEGATRRIVTLVKVRVEKTIVGKTPAEMDLVMLGGQVGTRGMKIPGMTSFRKGDRDILFISASGKALCPLVAVNHGRYQLVSREHGQGELVARADNTPLRTTADIEAPIEGASLYRASAVALPGAMSRDDFEAAIQTCARKLPANLVR